MVTTARFLKYFATGALLLASFNTFAADLNPYESPKNEVSAKGCSFIAAINYSRACTSILSKEVPDLVDKMTVGGKPDFKIKEYTNGKHDLILFVSQSQSDRNAFKETLSKVQSKINAVPGEASFHELTIHKDAEYFVDLAKAGATFVCGIAFCTIISNIPTSALVASGVKAYGGYPNLIETSIGAGAIAGSVFLHYAIGKFGRERAKSLSNDARYFIPFMQAIKISSQASREFFDEAKNELDRAKSNLETRNVEPILDEALGRFGSKPPTTSRLILVSVGDDHVAAKAQYRANYGRHARTIVLNPKEFRETLEKDIASAEKSK